MLEFYLFATGIYFYYSQSKYAPDFIFRFTAPAAYWLANLLFIAGAAAAVYQYGWTSGLILALCAISLAATLIPFFAVLGKKYFYGFAIVIQSLMLFELISYAG